MTSVLEQAKRAASENTEAARERYGEMVRDLAQEQGEHSPDSVLRTCEAAGIPFDQLERDVERQRQRNEAAAELAKLSEARAAESRAADELRRAENERAARVKELDARVWKAKAAHRDRAAELRDVERARDMLIKTAAPELLARRADAEANRSRAEDFIRRAAERLKVLAAILAGNRPPEVRMPEDWMPFDDELNPKAQQQRRDEALGRAQREHDKITGDVAKAERDAQAARAELDNLKTLMVQP